MKSFIDFLKESEKNSEPKVIQTSMNLGIESGAFSETIAGIVNDNISIEKTNIIGYSFTLDTLVPLGIIEYGSNQVEYLYPLVIFKEPNVYDVYPTPKNIVGVITNTGTKIYKLMFDKSLTWAKFIDVTGPFKEGKNILKYGGNPIQITSFVIPSDETDPLEEQFLFDMLEETITYKYISLKDYIAKA